MSSRSAMRSPRHGQGLSTVRGPAPVARTLYENRESIAQAQKIAEQRRFGTEPAQTLEQGRPTKRDRRRLAEWDRWSASADAPPGANAAEPRSALLPTDRPARPSGCKGADAPHRRRAGASATSRW